MDSLAIVQEVKKSFSALLDILQGHLNQSGTSFLLHKMATAIQDALHHMILSMKASGRDD